MDAAPVLWLTVVALGAYHGLNPAMGWPLAVANGLAERRDAAVLSTALPLATGHALAMALVLLPFALLAALVTWQAELRAGAGALVLGFGLWRFANRRHPRALARIAPTRLVAWSFLMALAHGAALMLLPAMLGLCATLPAGTGATARTAVAVALVHGLAMFGAGLAAAFAVYRWLGLAWLRRAWIDLDALWAGSLVVSGAAGLATALG